MVPPASAQPLGPSFWGLAERFVLASIRKDRITPPELRYALAIVCGKSVGSAPLGTQPRRERSIGKAATTAGWRPRIQSDRCLAAQELRGFRGDGTASDGVHPCALVMMAMATDRELRFR